MIDWRSILANSIRFEACKKPGAKGEKPHGYFYCGEARFPLAVFSLVAGRHIMNRIGNFEGEDKTVLEQEMVTAGIPEIDKSAEEDVAAVESIIADAMARAVAKTLSRMIARPFRAFPIHPVQYN